MAQNREFAWGASSSALQSEGSPISEGRTYSIWDAFADKKGKIYGGHLPYPSSNFYQEMESDIYMLSQLSLSHFRTSVSWSRVLPSGTGQINSKGIDFYKRLCDTCKAYGIEPWLTLYHWDLPQILEEKGGWKSRDIIGWFEEYVEKTVFALKDHCNHWMILNEPMVFTGAGYFLGIHAPGKKGIKNFLPALHHATVCQGAGGHVIREIDGKAIVGSTFSCSWIEPYSNSNRDKIAAKKVDALLNRLFLEPMLGMGYPMKDLPFLQRLEPLIKSGDMEKAQFTPDFIGIQNYAREVVKHSWFVPYLRARIIPAVKRKVPFSAMGWEIIPESLEHMIDKYLAYDIPEIIVTENGIAFETDNENTAKLRIDYINEILKIVDKKRKENSRFTGYFYWTNVDNFEWAEGYRPRFGLYELDLKTGTKKPREFALLYRDHITKYSYGRKAVHL